MRPLIPILDEDGGSAIFRCDQMTVRLFTAPVLTRSLRPSYLTSTSDRCARIDQVRRYLWRRRRDPVRIGQGVHARLAARAS